MIILSTDGTFYHFPSAAPEDADSLDDELGF